MIPKIIHYCWFGDNILPPEEQVFIEEWKSFHPDWQIRFWGNEDIDLSVTYLKKAYDLGNWANISNYIRLQALYKYGGIYLDTDIRLIKPLNELINHKCFLGFETDSSEKEQWLNNAVFGAVAAHPFLAECIEEINKYDGSERANLSSPVLVTNLLKGKFGKIEQSHSLQLKGDIALLQKDFFYPLPYSKVHRKEDFSNYITSNTIAIHFWKRSWLSLDEILDASDNQARFIDEQASYIHILEKKVTAFQENIGNEPLPEYTLNSIQSEIGNLLKQQHQLQISNAYISQHLETVEKTQIQMEKNLSKALQDPTESYNALHQFYNQKIIDIENKLNNLCIEYAVYVKQAEAKQKKQEEVIAKFTDNIQKIEQSNKAQQEIEILKREAVEIKVEQLQITIDTAEEKVEAFIQDFFENNKRESEKKAVYVEGTEIESLPLFIESDPIEINVLKETINNLETQLKNVNSLNLDLQFANTNLTDTLTDKEAEIEKQNFKIKTLNNYVDNFAHEKKAKDERIWLLENIIQDMRLINRSKKLIGQYKSKVNHLIFKG